MCDKLPLHDGGELSHWPVDKHVIRLGPSMVKPLKQKYSTMAPNDVSFTFDAYFPFTICGGGSHWIAVIFKT